MWYRGSNAVPHPGDQKKGNAAIRRAYNRPYNGHIIGQRRKARTEDNSAKCVIFKMKFLFQAAKEERGSCGRRMASRRVINMDISEWIQAQQLWCKSNVVDVWAMGDGCCELAAPVYTSCFSCSNSRSSHSTPLTGLSSHVLRPQTHNPCHFHRPLPCETFSAHAQIFFLTGQTAHLSLTQRCFCASYVV